MQPQEPPAATKASPAPKKSASAATGKGLLGAAGGRGKTRSAGAIRSVAKRAGLVFAPSRIMSNLRKGRFAKRIGAGAPVYLTGVAEYLAAEVLELAGNCCRDLGRKRIIPRDINMAFKRDDELNRLLGNTIITSGGVVPHIHSALVPQSKKSKSSKKTKTSHARVSNHHLPENQKYRPSLSETKSAAKPPASAAVKGVVPKRVVPKLVPPPAAPAPPAATADSVHEMTESESGSTPDDDPVDEDVEDEYDDAEEEEVGSDGE